MTTNGYSGIPPSLAIAVALVTKGSVQITAVGVPFFSNSIPSCTLHDEQDPQSPFEVITTSQVSAMSSSISDGHGLDALPLSSATDSLSSYSSEITS